MVVSSGGQETWLQGQGHTGGIEVLPCVACVFALAYLIDDRSKDQQDVWRKR